MTKEPTKRIPIGKRLRFEIFKRDGFQCIYCGRKPPEVVLHCDHVIAVANGGSNAETNLVTSCQPCNAGKSDVPLGRVPQTHLEGIELRKERLAQLQEMAEWSKHEAAVVDGWVSQVSHRWMKVTDRDPHKFELIEKDQATVRHFLTRIPLDQVMDAIEITMQRVPHKYEADQFRYFCGVCWKKIRDREDDAAARAEEKKRRKEEGPL